MKAESSTRAWHLPRLPSDGESRAGSVWELPAADPGGPVLVSPRLDARRANAIAEAVRAAALRARRERRNEEVIRSVSRAASRLARSDDEIGQQAEGLLRDWLGWSDSVVRESLDGMAREWTEAALKGLVASELGDPSLLGHFVHEGSLPGRRRMGIGPPLILQLHAGNVPGVPVSAAILALIARSGVLAKTGADEPWLLPLFARALAAEDPLLGDSLAVTWWPGGEQPEAFSEWAKQSGKAVVYGGDTAVRAIRAHIPASTELIVYGPRTGIAVLLSDAPTEAARLLARDTLAYEQRGCVSPRLVYVVRSNPLEIAERIASELAAEAERIGPPRLSDEEAVALRRARAGYEFSAPDLGASLAMGPPDLSWTVLVRDRPGIAADTLPRAVWVYAAQNLNELVSVLRPLEGRIQGIGYAGREGEERLASMAAELGVGRLCPIGEMAWPPPDWRQEGRMRLMPLLNWIDWEGSG